MTRWMLGREADGSAYNGSYHGGRHAYDANCSNWPRCVDEDPDYYVEEEVNAVPPEERVDTTSPRASILNEARNLITGDRNNQYGPPTQDFARTADLLNALGYRRADAQGNDVPILPSDVAIIIAQVKVSRLMHSRSKRDSWVDLAGYAACGYECTQGEVTNG